MVTPKAAFFIWANLSKVRLILYIIKGSHIYQLLMLELSKIMLFRVYYKVENNFLLKMPFCSFGNLVKVI